MARSRNIKPGFFVNEDLVELPYEVRLLFIGLWCLADREGRLENRPKKIKMALFPADDLDVHGALLGLAQCKLITLYSVDSIEYIHITEFKTHQNPHLKEKQSVIPAPDEHGASTVPAVLIPDPLNLIPDPLNLIPEVISSHGINYTDDFELFWKAYPSDRRGNKKRAFANWKKIPSGMYGMITERVKRRVVEAADWSSSKDRGYIIQAEGFLSGERWEESWVTSSNTPTVSQLRAEGKL